VNEPQRTYPRRPPRLAQVFPQLAPFYFVTLNTAKRAPFLAAPEVHAALGTFSQRAKQHNVAVGRYVIMPDHIHLFVMMPSEGIRLQQWVQSLKSVLGKALLGRGISKPHWQEGFFDHLMRSAESYAQKWEYVRRNPVRAGLCATPEEWPYQGEVVTIML
jgi:putative transposase